MLGYDYTSLRREVTVELGFNRDTTKWTTAETQDVDDVLRHGMQLYYSPPILPNERIAHRWSFLRPIYSLTTTSGVSDYSLPANYAGIDGSITWQRTGRLNCTIKVINEGLMRELRQSNSSVSSGDPICAAIWPETSNGSVQQVFKLGLYPTPQEASTLKFRYFSTQTELSAAFPVPLGMPIFGDAVRAAVMAACELKMDDTRGKHWQNYLERMAVAVSLDRANNEHTFMGRASANRSTDGGQFDPRSENTFTVRTV